MYWYYKWPLLIVCILTLLGIGTVVFRSVFPRQRNAENGSAVEATANSPASNGDTASANGTPQGNGASSSAAAATPEGQTTANSATSSAAESNTIVSRDPSRLSLEPVVDEKSLPSGTLKELLLAALAQLKNDQPLAARELARKAIHSSGVEKFDKTWWTAARIINAADTLFMNSAAPCPEKKRLIVRPGDSLSRLATQNYTTIGALQRVNELSRTSPVIHPGNPMQVFTGAWSIQVSKSQYVLCLYCNDELYRIYFVGIGRQDRTPVGSFTINSKIFHPAWTPPGKNIPYGEPGNVLGTHWMGLLPINDTNPALRGYGIHGTWEPDSIGTGASAGCIRMRNEEVEELYDFIPMPGSNAPLVKVTIEE
jgi:lipoprotein-anchoring transpeptidase ErfK/SrfK